MGEQGRGIVEYALVGAVLALAIIVAKGSSIIEKSGTAALGTAILGAVVIVATVGTAIVNR